MAKTKYAPQPEVVSGDLIVKIYPRADSEWVGTAQQLKDEGLTPKNLEWPTGFQDLHWSTTDGFDFWLRRTRPEGAKGPRRDFMEIGFWFLRRTRTVDRGRGLGNAEIYEKTLELQHALWRRSPEGQRMFQLSYRASVDKSFQDFKRRALGLTA